MNNEKTNKIKWIAVFTAIVLLFVGVISAIAVAISNKPVESKPDSNAENLAIATNDKPAILLSIGEPTVLAAPEVGGTDRIAESVGVSYDVTATLNPSDVENKKVDWKIEWSDDAPLKGKAITDYFTLTPTSDGALTAKLKCKKSFRGSSAILSATSRDSGVVGTCTVTFSGKPANMNIDVSGIGTQSRGKLTGVLQLKRGQTYTQSISLNNLFDDVGSEYSNYSVTVTGVGSFVKGDFRTTPTVDSWSGETNVMLDSVKSNFISAKIENGKLVIEAKERYENTRGKVVGGPSGATTYDMYKEDVTDASGNLPYFQIKVTENKSGLSKTLNVYIVSTVNTVNINYGNIDF